MLDVDDLLHDDALLPGDVVVDANNHKPMYVTGISTRDAVDVPAVWQSDINKHYHDIDPDETVMELVDIPTGHHYFIPEETRLYPEPRLKRLLTAPATNDRRPQEKVVRAVLANLVADAKDRGQGAVGDAILSLAADRWDDEYVEQIREFAEASATGRTK